MIAFLFCLLPESLRLHQIRAKYESLQTELEYVRRQSDADAAAVVAMTSRLDDADAEKQHLEAECLRLRHLTDDAKADERAKTEALENEVYEGRNRRVADVEFNVQTIFSFYFYSNINFHPYFLCNIDHGFTTTTQRLDSRGRRTD